MRAWELGCLGAWEQSDAGSQLRSIPTDWMFPHEDYLFLVSSIA